MNRISTDILIIGIGSAGFGALCNSLKLSKGKYKIIAIEKNHGMGGTSTYSGVNNWEPGVAGLGVHYKLAEALLAEYQAACVGKGNGVALNENIRWGTSIPCNDGYEKTLYRTNAGPLGCRRFHFEPEYMDLFMQKIIKDFDNIKINNEINCKINDEIINEIMFNTEFVSSKISDGKIVSVIVRNNLLEEEIEILPRLVLDCSADIVVARDAGCKYTKGEESRFDYDEPSAPDTSSDVINGITQIFSVTPCDKDYIQEIPEECLKTDVSEWMSQVHKSNCPVSCFNYYPNGDINVNMLPTMEGREYLALGEVKAKEICKARVYHYWRWIQQEKGFKGFKIKNLAPNLGVRETYRLIGNYVLTEQDARAGLLQQSRRDELIAFSDHPLDTHGKTNVKGARCPELDKPYGIPYSCLLTNEISNMLVACRGASFSHIAASSSRLSRTMLALGEAAGVACVLALESGVELKSVDVIGLREILQIPKYEVHIME